MSDYNPTTTKNFEEGKSEASFSASTANPTTGDWRNTEQSFAETKRDATAAVLEKDSAAGNNGKNQGKMADHDERQSPPITETLNEAKRQVKSTFDEQKSQAAERLGGVASALRQTSSDLQSQEQQAFAQYIEEAAGQVDKFSQYLRDKNVSQMFNDVQGMARRQPELFAAGALAAGFLLGRFLKSSNAQSQTRYNNNNDYVEDLYGGRPQTGGAWSAQNSPMGQNIPISNRESQYGR